MSVSFQFDDCSLVDHRDFTLKVYKNVITDVDTCSYALTEKIFSILTSNKKQGRRKRSHNANEILDETLMVKQMYENFKTTIPTDIRTNVNKYNLLNTTAVRDLSKQLFETTVFDHTGVDGGNNANNPFKNKVKQDYFLIPPKSSFFCGYIDDECEKLAGNKYDLVIADPPWWNKFIRRLKSANNKLSYKMMYNEEIAAVPIKNLCSSNCLVAVWCTNAPNNIAAVKNLIFPSWGVEYITTWYWLKVTVELEPVCDFGWGSEKQPYERLILGKVGQLNKLPEKHLIVSVPSALHSHKPPLLDLLSPYVSTGNPKTLELFARYLLPNTTSVGFEPLKWQHISLYDEVI